MKTLLVSLLLSSRIGASFSKNHVRPIASQSSVSATVDNLGDTKETISTSIVSSACFGAGCFWGTEKYFMKEFSKFGKGKIIGGQVGFMGPPGSLANASYEQVCGGATGLVEVFKFEFDGGLRQFEQLVKFFFMFHDPTTRNAQGNDRGSQYASTIFFYSQEQLEVTKRVISDLQRHISDEEFSPYERESIVTNVLPATDFFAADESHQKYLEKNPYGYCNHRFRFKQWPQK